MTEVPLLRVDVLGTPAITWDGERLNVDTRKALAILAILATRASEGAGSIGRDELAAMFWPDVPDERARGNLRRTLSVLVAATGDSVAVERTSVALRASTVTSDIVRMRALALSQDPGDLAQAVALVRGEFLAGFSIRGCEAFDSWSAATSDSLRRELAAVLDRLVRLRLRQGELHAALADAARWLELDPLHEPAYRLVMKLLAWTGRRQDALDQYRRCVRVLADELGVAPVRATTAVFEAIRTGTLGSPKARESQPRAAPPPDHATGSLPMVGRESAMATLLAAAGQPGRLILITGEGGVGRSRLVEEYVARIGPVLLSRAHEAQAAESFAPIADLLRQALAHSPAPDADVAVEISRVLPECLPAGRSLPLAMDSLGGRDRFFDAVLRTLAAADVRAVIVEDVHGASAAVSEVLAYLLHRLDQLRAPLLLTCRDPGLPLRHPVRLALAAGRLAERATFVPLSRLTLEDVAELVGDGPLKPGILFAETAGLPMLVTEAIRAGRSDILSMPVRDLLAARLAEASEETGQVLAALAVLGGLSETSALRATSGRSELETVEAIEEALLVGLIREEGLGVAFAHDALRRVAYDQLSLVRRRLLHARAAHTVMAEKDSALRAAQVAHHWHQAGQDVLAADWAWTAATRAADLYAHQEVLTHLDFVVGLGQDHVDVALAQGEALIALARYEEALVVFERAASLAPEQDAGLRSRIERKAADIHARAGEWDLADAGLAAAEDLLDGTVDGVLRSQILADRALVALRAGNRLAAEHAAAAADVVGGDVAYVHNAVGLVALAGAEAERAHDAFAVALAATSDVAMRAAVMNNLARAKAAGGDSEGAVTSAQEALALGEIHGDRHRLAALHSNLADRLHDIGRNQAAMEQLTLAARLFAEVGQDALERPHVWTLTSW